MKKTANRNALVSIRCKISFFAIVFCFIPPRNAYSLWTVCKNNLWQTDRNNCLTHACGPVQNFARGATFYCGIEYSDMRAFMQPSARVRIFSQRSGCCELRNFAQLAHFCGILCNASL